MDPYAPAHALIGRQVRIYQDGIVNDDGGAAEVLGEVNGVSIDVLSGLEPNVRLLFDVDDLGEWWVDTDDLRTVRDFADPGPFQLPLGNHPVKLAWDGEAACGPEVAAKPLPSVRARRSSLAE